MSRIEKEQVDLDYAATLAFFRARGGRKLGRVGVTAYQDRNPELALERDAVEKTRVIPLLDLTPELRILDLGCGAGRWVDDLGEVQSYLGIDYAAELLDIGRERFRETHPRVCFQELSVTALGETPLELPPPFDRILVSGLCIYLNDADLDRMLATLPDLASARALIYVREPASLLDHRLTLKEHYSDELAAESNAIYRTPGELRSFFQTHLGPAGFAESAGGALYPPELDNRRETQQHYFVLARGGP